MAGVGDKATNGDSSDSSVSLRCPRRALEQLPSARSWDLLPVLPQPRAGAARARAHPAGAGAAKRASFGVLRDRCPAPGPCLQLRGLGQVPRIAQLS